MKTKARKQKREENKETHERGLPDLCMVTDRDVVQNLRGTVYDICKTAFQGGAHSALRHRLTMLEQSACLRREESVCNRRRDWVVTRDREEINCKATRVDESEARKKKRVKGWAGTWMVGQNTHGHA